MSDLLDLAGYQPTLQPDPTKWTERAVLDMLRSRYLVSGGNGPRYAFAEHVRSQVGHDAPRCADAIAMSLWASDDMALHGHEVKVSRADWLAELKHPEKADAFRRYMDFWWLVVPDAGIVRGDLPDGWGLMVPTKDGRLRITKRAPRRTPEPMPRGMQACLLRATAKTARRALTMDATPRRWAAEAIARRTTLADDEATAVAVDVVEAMNEAVRW